MMRRTLPGRTNRFRIAARFTGTLLSFGLLLAHVAISFAQLPIAELTTVYPPGGKQGTTFDVTTAGSNLDDAAQLRFSHPGITAKSKMSAPSEFLPTPKPVPNSFEVQIAADVPPGVYEARVTSRFGTSNPRAFMVGSQQELVDDGSNKQFAAAKEITVGTTVNGRVDGSAVDYYKVALRQGQRVLIDCWAERLDSRLDATLILYDANGAELARNTDYVGRDPFLDFTAPAEGAYVIGIHDFVFGGGAEYAYRLQVHSESHIDFVFPPAGVAGSSGTFAVYGRNLPGGKPAEDVLIAGKPLEKAEVSITIPETPGDGLAGVGDHLALAGATLDAIDYRLGGSNAVRIGVARTPTVVAEQESNNEPAQAQTVPAPCEVAGQFYPRRDTDYFQFQAQKGDVFQIEVISHRLGLDTDPHMLIQRVTKNEEGTESVSDVAYLDDPGDRNGRIGSDFDTSTDDPSYRFTASDDGLYRLKVSDQFGDARDDPRMLYRLVIRREEPDFRLLLFTQQIKVANNNQVLMFAPVLRKGGTTLVRVDAERRDGFNGKIEISAEGLPEGVSCRPVIMGPAVNSVWLVLAAAENAPQWSGTFQIVGKSQLNGQQAVRRARSGSVVWGTGNRTQTPASFRVARDVGLSICTDTAPALVEVGDGTLLETSKGGKLDIPVKVTRRHEFKENIKLVATGLPGEVKPGDITINGDQTEGTLSFAVTNAKAKAGVYSFFLRSDTKVKLVRNPDAIRVAEEEQKQLDQAVKQIAEQVQQATAASNQANQAAQQAANAVKQAEAARNTAAQAQQQTANAAKGAAEKLAAAQAAADKTPDDQALKDARDAAQKASDQAALQAKQAAQKLAAAEKALAESQAAAKQAEEAKNTAAQKLKELQEKSKRATAAKAAADKRVADTKKANAAKDVNFALVSTPVTVRIVDSPIQLNATAPAAIKQGTQVEIPVALQRLYGFAEAVQISAELPKGVSGLSVANLTIPKEQSEGKLQLTANDKATPGEHSVTIRAKAQFNKINVEASQQVVVKIEAAEPSDK